MKDYGMFTVEGNTEIAKLIIEAIENKWDWPHTYAHLVILANNPKFDEALDTMVRESVYDALKFDTPFYGV